jgi:NAD(P)-dependent dehydrogenase (short-subunit alcohol dehydrogenase family)
MNETTKEQGILISGAGTGIGGAIARALDGEGAGYRLYLLGRDPARLEQTRSALADPARHRVVRADLRDPRGLAEALERAELGAVPLRAVIANAGLGGENHYGASDRWDEILATNLTGTYHLVNLALPALRRGGAGPAGSRHVLVVSSILGRIGVPRHSAYCASKAGLLGLMRSWASELAPEGIRVNALCPGWVETDMAREGLAAMSATDGMGVEQVRARELGRVPLGRMSQPEELGALAAFLISGRERSITGQAIDVNNGAYFG